MGLAETFFKIHKQKDSNGDVIGFYITYGDGVVLETTPATFNDFIDASKYLEAYLSNEMLNNKKARLDFKITNKNEIENKNVESPQKTVMSKIK